LPPVALTSDLIVKATERYTASIPFLPVETQPKELRMNIKKPILAVKESAAELLSNAGPTTRPKNPSANTIPTEGFVLEIDGKFKTEYDTADSAMKAALELKQKYSQIQVSVYDAKEHSRTLVELTGNEAKA
jgi:hypothetical protein